MKKTLILIITITLMLASCADPLENAEPTAESSQSVTPEPTEAPTPVPTDTPEPTAEPTPELSVYDRTISVSGAYTMEMAAYATLEEFIHQNPDYTYRYTATESHIGMQNAGAGITQLGACDRELTDAELAVNLSQTLIGYNSLTIIANEDTVPVDNLSMEQLKAIFTGEITNWSQLDGPDEDIIVYIREENSADRTFFDKMMGIDYGMTDAELAGMEGANYIINRWSSVIAFAVDETPYSIGYVGYWDSGDDYGKKISIDGAAPVPKDIHAGEYPLASPFYFVYSEDYLGQASREYLDFVTSSEGQSILVYWGIVPVKGIWSDETNYV